MGKYREYAPALFAGNKIMPYDIAGMIDLPYVGNIYYVDPTNGSDTANNGSEQNKALKTVAAAYAKCTAYQNDVVLIVPTGTTVRTTETAAIVWAKGMTHLIGNGAPTMFGKRSGMEFSSAVVSPCFTVNAIGCIFKNLYVIVTEDINVLWKVTANQNYFSNCWFAGAANTTTGNDAAARSVVVSAASENTFDNCVFGTETANSSAANGSLEFTGTCRRNVVRHCLFDKYDTAGTSFHVIADTGNCMEMALIFEDCMFINPLLIGSTTIQAALIRTTLTNAGIIYLNNCTYYGATAIADVLTHVMCFQTTGDTTAQGLFVVAG